MNESINCEEGIRQQRAESESNEELKTEYNNSWNLDEAILSAQLKLSEEQDQLN